MLLKQQLITHMYVHCSISRPYRLTVKLDIAPALNRPRQPFSFEATIFILRNNEAILQSHTYPIDTLHCLSVYRQIDAGLKAKHMSRLDLPFAQRPLY